MNLKNGILCSLAALPLLAGCYGGENAKDSGSDERMQNATIAIVTGVAAERMYGSSSIDAQIERPLSFDSHLSDTTSKDCLDVRVEIPLKDSRFQASKVNGMWVGGQDKMMFDWAVDQIDGNTYRISRVGLDGELEIHMSEGIIQGEYRKPMGLDFGFEGTIAEDGTYRLTLERPLSFDWTVKGTIRR